MIAEPGWLRIAELSHAVSQYHYLPLTPGFFAILVGIFFVC